MDAMTKAALTPARRRLVELMQETNHGRIERLRVGDGQPLFDVPPTVLRLFLFGKPNGPNESRGSRDFALKRSVLELFEIFDREQTLVVEELMIDDGLPVRMTVADRVRA